MKLNKTDEEKRLARKRKHEARIIAAAERATDEDWIQVAVAAHKTGNPGAAFYTALYDEADPLVCARMGRAIRIRIADWRAWWERKRTTIEPGSPARAPRRNKSVQP